MCPACEGIGTASTIDEDALVDRDRPLNDGAITVPNFGVGTWYWRPYGESDRLDADKPLHQYSPEEWDWLMHAEPVRVRLGHTNTEPDPPRPQERTAQSRQAQKVRQAPRGVRQWEESVFDTLTDQLTLEDHRGRTPAGVYSRVAARLLSLTAGI